MTILGETRLTLFLLGGHVVRDKGVVALLAEGVLALHLLVVDRLLHLHQLLDAPHVVLLFSGLLLLSGIELGLLGVFVLFRVSVGVRSHGVPELVEQSPGLGPLDLPGHGLLLSVRLLAELLLLALLEILLLLQVAVLLLAQLCLLVVELLLRLLNVDHGGLLPIQVLVQTKERLHSVCRKLSILKPEAVLFNVVLALVLLGKSVLLPHIRRIVVVKIIVYFLIIISNFSESFLQVSQKGRDILPFYSL